MDPLQIMKMTDAQLMGNAGAGQGTTLEIIRRLKDSIEKLDNSVNTFNNTSSKQQNVLIELAQESGKQTEQMLKLNRRIVWLTWVIAILTTIILIGLGIQIWLA